MQSPAGPKDPGEIQFRGQLLVAVLPGSRLLRGIVRNGSWQLFTPTNTPPATTILVD